MPKTLSGIFADVCYAPFPTIVIIEDDYKTVHYKNLLTGDVFRTVSLQFDSLFLRTASKVTEIRCVAQIAISQHVNKLAIIYNDGHIEITQHNCSGQEGCYIQCLNDKFEIYCKIDSWNYIIILEDGTFTDPIPIPFPEGTVQGIIDILHGCPGYANGTIFWGEERTREVGGLKFVYPVYRNGVTFGQEYSKVDRLVGNDNVTTQNFLALDNKLGKYPHLATDSYQYLSCWAELNNVIGYEFYPPFPPYTPPIVIDDPVPTEPESEKVDIPYFAKANHNFDLMIPDSPSDKKRLTWIGDSNPTESNVVGLFFTYSQESIPDAVAICKAIKKPLCFYVDGNDFGSNHESICKDIETANQIEVWRSWNCYPKDSQYNESPPYDSLLRIQNDNLSRTTGKVAPWFAFYRQIYQVVPEPKFTLKLSTVVSALDHLWQIFAQNNRCVGINGFTYDRANGKDGVIAWKELQECERLMRENIPQIVIVPIPPPVVITKKKSFWEKLLDLLRGRK